MMKIVWAVLLVGTPVQGQFLRSLADELLDNPEFSANDRVNTSEEFLTLLNEQGDIGRLWIGPFSTVESGELQIFDQFELFAANSDVSLTFEYELQDEEVSVTEFVSVLNTQGQLGYQYAAPISFGNFITGENIVTRYLFARTSGSQETFEYQTLPTTEASLNLEVINTQGASGWEWLGPQVVGSFPNLELVDLFVRRAGQNEIFTYFQEATTRTPTSFLDQVNAQGELGRFWMGDFVVSNGLEFESFAVFRQNSQQDSTYTYSLLPSVNTRASLLEQANAQGEEGFAYLSPQVFPTDNPAIFTSFELYISRTAERGVGPTSEDFNLDLEDDQLTFSTSVSGNFQLFESENLVDWNPLGEIRSSVGEDIIWVLEPSELSQRFFTVGRISDLD